MKSILNHNELSDTEFIEQLNNCSINPKTFNHEAHLRLAWILINELAVDKAIKAIQQLLLRFVTHVGATDKYHTTVTIIAIKAVNHFMQKSKTEKFEDFIIENNILKTNFKALINCHYSIDVFTSVRAKSSFLKPDLLPFE
ncbi:hypothetical protein A9Q86_09525 [Flavobacteriales bacterium 33_180_T64]|nr:hypothetical protein A9Q86_09525 [Flavobacteriales bacterium 33_180_T64]